VELPPVRSCTLPVSHAMMPDCRCSPTALFMSMPSKMRILSFTGSNGARMGLRMGAVSVPVGVYRLRTVPPGWYTATKRRPGMAVAA
jgi:hypothetical protein